MTSKNGPSFEDLRNLFTSGNFFNNFVVKETQDLDGFPGFPGKVKKVIFLVSSNKPFSMVIYAKPYQLQVQIFNYDKPEEFFEKKIGNLNKKTFSEDSGRQNRPFILSMNIKSAEYFERKRFWLDIQIPAKGIASCSYAIDVFLNKIKPFLL